MQDVTTVYGPDVFCFDGHDIQRMSIRAENLELITFMLAVNHHDHANITGTKLNLRQVDGQRNTIM